MEAFNGDSYVKKKVDQFIKRERVNLIIETGTYLGQTTDYFSRVGKHVITIESNEKYLAKAKKRLGTKFNLRMFKGYSPNVLNEILKDWVEYKTLFYLDAHWGGTPLLEELTEIAEAKFSKPPVIVIHDFKVPGRPDLGFDTYGGQPYEWSWIEPFVNQIYSHYSRDPKVEYNDLAEGARRGVIYLS